MNMTLPELSNEIKLDVKEETYTTQKKQQIAKALLEAFQAFHSKYVVSKKALIERKLSMQELANGFFNPSLVNYFSDGTFSIPETAFFTAKQNEEVISLEKNQTMAEILSLLIGIPKASRVVDIFLVKNVEPEKAFAAAINLVAPEEESKEESKEESEENIEEESKKDSKKQGTNDGTSELEEVSLTRSTPMPTYQQLYSCYKRYTDHKIIGGSDTFNIFLMNYLNKAGDVIKQNISLDWASFIGQFLESKDVEQSDKVLARWILSGRELAFSPKLHFHKALLAEFLTTLSTAIRDQGDFSKLSKTLSLLSYSKLKPLFELGDYKTWIISSAETDKLKFADSFTFETLRNQECYNPANALTYRDLAAVMKWSARHGSNSNTLGFFRDVLTQAQDNQSNAAFYATQLTIETLKTFMTQFFTSSLVQADDKLACMKLLFDQKAVGIEAKQGAHKTVLFALFKKIHQHFDHKEALEDLQGSLEDKHLNNGVGGVKSWNFDAKQWLNTWRGQQRSTSLQQS